MPFSVHQITAYARDPYVHGNKVFKWQHNRADCSLARYSGENNPTLILPKWNFLPGLKFFPNLQLHTQKKTVAE